jgi:hypothetical protein
MLTTAELQSSFLGRDRVARNARHACIQPFGMLVIADFAPTSLRRSRGWQSPQPAEQQGRPPLRSSNISALGPTLSERDVFRRRGTLPNRLRSPPSGQALITSHPSGIPSTDPRAISPRRAPSTRSPLGERTSDQARSDQDGNGQGGLKADPTNASAKRTSSGQRDLSGRTN